MLLAALWPGLAPAQETEPYNSGWALYLDNDALALADRDRDYTGGVALTLAGERARSWWFSLNPLLALGDSDADAPRMAPRHAMQFGVLAFTPRDIKVPAVQGDRPYASLVYLANSRMSFADDPDVAYLSTLALGALGLDVAETVTRLMHAAIDTNQARGWNEQISDGGEPTFRYSFARLHRLAASRPGAGGDLELVDSFGVSAGYLTEATAGLSLRWGWIGTPFWSFTPERSHYMADAAPVAANTSPRRELYAWVGVMARARLYNAFLQGQLRDSALSYHREETRSLLGEAWLGLTAQLDREFSLSFTVRGQTSELRTFPGDRDLLWGGVTVNRAF